MTVAAAAPAASGAQQQQLMNINAKVSSAFVRVGLMRCRKGEGKGGKMHNTEGFVDKRLSANYVAGWGFGEKVCKLHCHNT